MSGICPPNRPLGRILKLAAALGAIAIAIAPQAAAAADAPLPSATILVAASTQDAVAEIARAFEKKTGVKIVISPGPSNALANQIINGAPADLYLSANRQWAEKVRTEGLAADVRPLLGNGLVIVVPRGNPAKIAAPADLAKQPVRRIALAGEKVPAGIYAQQSLEKLQLYRRLAGQRKIVRGEDVRAALGYVERGEVEAGIVYATDAKLSTKVTAVYTFDPQTHAKIVYPLVLTKRGKRNPAATKFEAYLLSDKAAAVFAQFGFTRLK